MFLRSTRRKKNGETHEYWNIVENNVSTMGVWSSARFFIWERSIPRRWMPGGAPSRWSTSRPGRREPWRCFRRTGGWRRGTRTRSRSRLSEMRLCRPRQWGACWLAGQLWRPRTRSLLKEPAAGRSPASRPRAKLGCQAFRDGDLSMSKVAHGRNRDQGDDEARP